MFERIRYEVSDGIGTITLARPDKLNAYTPEMGEEIVAAFERAREDVAVRVLVLTGAGRAFCAGVDLDCFRAHMAGESPSRGPKLGEEAFVNTWPLDLVDFPKPVNAAINGAAYGVGVTMTLGWGYLTGTAIFLAVLIANRGAAVSSRPLLGDHRGLYDLWNHYGRFRRSLARHRLHRRLLAAPRLPRSRVGGLALVRRHNLCEHGKHAAGRGLLLGGNNLLPDTRNRPWRLDSR